MQTIESQSKAAVVMQDSVKMRGCLNIRARFQRKHTIHNDASMEQGVIVGLQAVKKNASHTRRNRFWRLIRKTVKKQHRNVGSSTVFNSARTYDEGREEIWFDTVEVLGSSPEHDFESVHGDSVAGLSRSNQASPKPPFLPIEERAEKQALTDATLTNDKGILKALFSFKHEERKMETEENDDSLSSDSHAKILQRSCLAGLLPSVSFNDRKLSISPSSNKAKANLRRLSFKWCSFNERVDSSIPHDYVERPSAGSQIPFSAGNNEGTWCWVNPSPFKLRGPSYPRDKRKIPASEYEMYKPFGVDIFRSSKKINHIAEYVDIPTTPNIGKFPSLLILNIQIPLYPASIFLSDADGEGLNLVSYYKLAENYLKVSPNFREMFLRIVNDEDEKIHGFAKDSIVPYRERLKILGRVENVEELNISVAERKLIHAYNDKPVLSRPQHNFFLGENYIEIDLDVHRFSYLARKGVETFIEQLSQSLLNIGLTIQGHKPEELPEHILCAVCINKIDFKNCKWISAE